MRGGVTVNAIACGYYWCIKHKLIPAVMNFIWADPNSCNPLTLCGNTRIMVLGLL